MLVSNDKTKLENQCNFTKEVAQLKKKNSCFIDIQDFITRTVKMNLGFLWIKEAIKYFKF